MIGYLPSWFECQPPQYVHPFRTHVHCANLCVCPSDFTSCGARRGTRPSWASPHSDSRFSIGLSGEAALFGSTPPQWRARARIEHKCTHTHTHTRLHIHICTQHTQTCNTHTHAHKNIRTHSHPHAPTRTHTEAHMRMLGRDCVSFALHLLAWSRRISQSQRVERRGRDGLGCSQFLSLLLVSSLLGT